MLPPGALTTATAVAAAQGTSVPTVTGRPAQPGAVRDALARLETHDSFRLTATGVYLRPEGPPLRIVVEKSGGVRRGLIDGGTARSQELYQTEDGVFAVGTGGLQRVGETPILTTIPAVVYGSMISRHLDWRDDGPVAVDGRPARRWVGEGTLDEFLASSPGPGVAGPARAEILIAEADGALLRASTRFGVGTPREAELLLEIADIDAVPPIVPAP